jgi:hypothetical protein
MLDEFEFWENPIKLKQHWHDGKHKPGIRYPKSLEWYDHYNKIKGALEKQENHWKHHGINVKEFR